MTTLAARRSGAKLVAATSNPADDHPSSHWPLGLWVVFLGSPAVLLGGSAELTAADLAYLALFSMAIVVSMEEQFGLLRSSGVAYYFLIVAMAGAIGVVQGNNLSLVGSQVFTYLSLPCAIAFGRWLGPRLQPSLTVGTFLLVGGFSAVLYGLEWNSRRGLLDAGREVVTQAGSVETYVGFALIIAVWAGLNREVPSIVATIAVVTCVFGLVASGSRTLLAPIVLAGLLLGAGLLRRRASGSRLGFIVLLSIAGMAGVIASTAFDDVGLVSPATSGVERISDAFTQEDTSLSTRAEHGRVVWDAFVDRPWTGSGLGTEFRVPDAYGQLYETPSPDSPANILGRFGIFGVLLVLLLGAELLRCLRQAPQADRGALFVGLVCLVVMLVLSDVSESAGLPVVLAYLGARSRQGALDPVLAGTQT